MDSDSFDFYRFRYISTQDELDYFLHDQDFEDRMINQIDNLEPEPTPVEIWNDAFPDLAARYLNDQELFYLSCRFMPPDPDAKIPVPYREMTKYTGRSVRWNHKMVERALAKIRDGLKKDFPALYILLNANNLV